MAAPAHRTTRPGVAGGLVLALVIAGLVALVAPVVGPLAVPAAAAPTGPTLVENGSFERDRSEGPLEFPAGGQGLSGWEVTGGTARNQPDGADGDLSLVLSGPAGGVAQELVTTAGRSYEVRWARSLVGTEGASLDLRVDGTTLATTAASTPAWTYATATFTATGPRTSLAFVATAGTPALDGVSVLEVDPDDLITNGGFQVPSSPGTFAVGDDRLLGWTTTQGSVDTEGLVDGTDEAYLALVERTAGPGVVTQTVPVVPSQTYVMRFRYARTQARDTAAPFTVLVGGSEQRFVASQALDPEVGTGWTRGTVFFTTIASSATIGFRDTDVAGEPGGALVDDVSMVPQAPTTLTTTLSVDAAETTPGASQVPLGDVSAGALRGDVVERIAAAPLRRIPLRTAPLRRIPLTSIPLRRIPLEAAPLRRITLDQLPLSGGTTWDQVLAGTPYVGTPIQQVTLDEVLDDDAARPNPVLAGIDLDEVDLSTSPLRSISVAATYLGDVALGDLPVTGGTTAHDAVCGGAAAAACRSAGVTPASPVLAADLATAPLRRIPLGSIPLRRIATQALPLASIPLRRIPLSALPVRDTPLRRIPLRALDGLDVAASPVGDLRIDDLGPDSVLRQVLEGRYAGDTRLRDLLAEIGGATLGDLGLAAGGAPGALTLDDLAPHLAGTITLADALASLVDLDQVPWEDVPYADLDLPGASTAPLVTFSATVDLDGAGGADRDVTATMTLPPGFTLADPSGPPTGPPVPTPTTGVDDTGATTLTWLLPARSPGLAGSRADLEVVAHPPLTLTAAPAPAVLRAVAPAPTGADETDLEDTAAAGVQVVEPAVAADPADAPVLGADVLAVGHTAVAGRPTYLRVPAPPAGTRVSVLLSHLPVDGDVVVYGPGETDAPSAAPLRRIPLRRIPLPDPGTDAATALVAPQVLQDDVPRLPDREVVGFSVQRGTEHEVVDLVSPGGGGDLLVQVTGYNGAASPAPWLLRVRETAPVETTCPARPATPQAPGATDTAPSVPDGTRALFLIDRAQHVDRYGEAATERVLASLRALAARADVRGAVVLLDQHRPVATAYDAWNAAPCSISTVNAVARATTGLITALHAARRTITSVTLVGSDEQLPMARVPDLTSSVNERTFAAQDAGPGGADNPFTAAQEAGYLLSDDPYGTLAPIAWLDRELHVPELAVGRLVETPDQVVAQVDQYVAAGGVLDPTSALTTGYDFLTDGAEAVDAGLASALPRAAALTREQAGAVTRTRLIDEAWDRADLLDALLPPTGAPGVAAVNAHFDQSRALPAAGNTTGDETDLVTTRDLDADPAGPDALAGRLLFSMGCHAGLDVPLGYSGLTDAATADWPKQLATQRALWVANTGYGLGDTATVALSESIMRNFAQRLDGSLSAGAALAFAKQAYLGELGAYGAADEKALQEVVLHGLPMWRIGGARSDGSTDVVLPPVTPLERVVPVRGSGTVAAAALTTLDRTTTSTFTERSLPTGRWWEVDGETQTTAGAPVQPRTSYAATPQDPSAGTAHGVLVTGLESRDVPGVSPQFARAVIDDGGNEPAQQVPGTSFPAGLATLSTAASPAAPGEETRVVLVPGQFTAAPGETTGTQRLFETVDTRVYYSDSDDHTPATFRSLRASSATSGSTFTVDVAAPAGQAVVRVLVLVRPEGSGTWVPVELTSSGGSTWTGRLPGDAGDLEWFAQAVTDAGNVATSTNKGDFYGASAGVDVALSGETGAADWFTGPVTLTPDGPSTSYAVKVDDAAPVTVAPGTGVVVTGDGPHTLVVTGSGGDTTTRRLRIDATVPVVTITDPPGGVFTVGGPGRATVSCADAVSGLASPCPAGLTVPTGQAGDAVAALDPPVVDGAGNRTTGVAYRVVAAAPPPPPPTPVPEGLTFRFLGASARPGPTDVRAGRTVPVRFRVTGGAASVATITTSRSTCRAGAPRATGPVRTLPPSRLEGTTGALRYPWVTRTAWAGQCRTLTVRLVDGAVHRVVVRLTGREVRRRR